MFGPSSIPTHDTAAAGARHGSLDQAHERAEALLAEVEGCADALRRAELRREAVVLTLDLADGVARRFRGRGKDYEDLVQVGRVALLKAAHGYRCGYGYGYGSSFAAYAVPTIAGEIKRHFRDHAWMVRPPRRMQELRAELIREEDSLRQWLLRDPTQAELARSLGRPRSDVRDAHECSRAYRAISLDVSSDVGAHELVTHDPGIDDLIVDRDVLVRALEGLSDRERLIVRLRFVEERTQAEIGVVLGVSQMQVSRLLAGILSKLRNDLLELAA
ncbi:sigma-70 family RNA polymerase sigma factor [Pedococcus bigeumensis]|uniref:sigma-70 family RNA polymerase sigma factor n=1 Tax=Pedococcus bigeumensis TaxID=433644 RepID=UPI0013867E88|nr:sigma-70 family RNA polymerase sigma factor [Pedococcus bigeumensis]